MCNRAGFVCLESAQDFERWGNDSDGAIVASKEETLRTRADAAYFISVEEGCALVVRRFDLANLEEVERLPLHGRA